MKTTITALAALALLVTSAMAHDYKVGSLKIDHPWARATPKGASVGGGYMKITNTGTTPDRLVGGSSTVSGRFEVHEMSMDNGVMRMRPLKDGLEIKPGQTVELKPGSFHIMLLDLKQPLKENERVKGTLTFEKAGTVEVEYAVVAVGASPGGKDRGGKDHGGMDQGGMSHGH
ncbi:MAG TPA: copper chaperone PCu(A)C [Xanthobacteraceae bacterium]|nr:copper chaperone PCu(A)C [Xanthobacteraceae bacterium]